MGFSARVRPFARTRAPEYYAGAVIIQSAAHGIDEMW
jgi:hypothetical protein